MPFTVAGLSRVISALLFISLCTAWAAPAPAATVQVNSLGALTGASDVDVNGTLYDVAFVEGSCAQLFFPCLFPSALAFSTFSEANAAAQALLDQVFLDVAQGAFDTRPGLTNGCTEPNPCTAFVPYALIISESAVSVLTRDANNSDEAPGNFLDVVGAHSLDANDNSVNRLDAVFAVFTPAQVSAVPEPASNLLLVSGAVVLSYVRRRARRHGGGFRGGGRRVARSKL